MPGNARQLRPVQRTVRHHDEARLNRSPRSVLMIQRAAASSQRSSVIVGLEQRVVVEVVVPRDARGSARRSPARTSTSPSACSRALRAAAGSSTTRRRTARRDSGSSTRCRRSRRAALDDADALEARFAQPRAHQQAAEAAADDRDLDLVEQRLAREARLDVRVVDVVRELRRHLDVLLVAVRAQRACRAPAGTSRAARRDRSRRRRPASTISGCTFMASL